ncbi:MAG: substrate-binding domain-containing protein [Sulfurifustaceae bacterium]
MSAALWSSFAWAMPTITGKPTVDRPQLLAWPRDSVSGAPDLSEPTANVLSDFHAHITRCDLVLSTAGNYHMALKELWPIYLERFGGSIDNWVYTTSPPVASDQIANKRLIVGNTTLACAPQVVVAPKGVMERLQTKGLLASKPVPLYNTQGNVLLVKKGNPKKIRSVWDLARNDVAVATPNPDAERGSFNVYAESIYEVARQDKSVPGRSADKLFNAIFNSGRPGKWYTGARIHHREVPWSVAYGRADVGVLFYHLAMYTVQQFPDQFEIVPLGGSVDQPQQLAGNRSQEHFIAKINGDWTATQQEATDRLVSAMLSPEFAAILQRHGIVPANSLASMTTKVASE